MVVGCVSLHDMAVLAIVGVSMADDLASMIQQSYPWLGSPLLKIDRCNCSGTVLCLIIFVGVLVCYGIKSYFFEGWFLDNIVGSNSSLCEAKIRTPAASL